MNTQNIFQRIRLIGAGDPDHWGSLRGKAEVSNQKKEICLKLSREPEPDWRNEFFKAWRVWHPEIPAPYIRVDSLFVTATFDQFPLHYELVKATIDEANERALPYIRSRAGQIAVAEKRKALLDKAYREDLKSSRISVSASTSPREADAQVEEMLYKRARAQDASQKAIALAELDSIISYLAESEIEDALNRI